ncbi:hypothetical protein ACJDU8_25175 [Clostridium sp. WILCCON 0269]|uniref:Uncharacterized protein n=1 Tax=Candidatus Clostridium eludens TaxID=3381663 RepID=A0ABW8SVH8_9CLOT
MPVIPIDQDYSNINCFIDSLFSADVRNLKTITNAITSGSFYVNFSSQSDKIVKVWTAAWQALNNIPYNAEDFLHCQPSDKTVIAFLSHFIYNNNLRMQFPQLEYLGGKANTQLPIYQLTGYTEYCFYSDGKWQMDTVNKFLQLLMLGGHFVFIQDKIDLPPNVSVQSYYESFKNSKEFEIYRRKDPGNSHYTSLLNTTGYYVPDINSDKAPNPCPFMMAYLVASTNSNIIIKEPYSTFMQLEGWESPYGRHNTDYDNYKSTLWNISTFGACAYSEKRGTTIFLAPYEWKPEINEDTIMPKYAGAETRQKWLNVDLIKI